jgi:hypothetical protein
LIIEEKNSTMKAVNYFGKEGYIDGKAHHHGKQAFPATDGTHRRLRRMPNFLPVGLQDVLHRWQPGLPEVGCKETPCQGPWHGVLCVKTPA